MPTMDVFNSDAFSAISLTDAVNKVPFKPGFLGRLGIFEERGIPTTVAMIEEREGKLNLIGTSPRGAPPEERSRDKRKARNLSVPHIAKEAVIYADEVQSVRAFGTESDVEAVQGVLDQEIEEVTRDHDATLEHHRLGAIKGQVLDADGVTVILDLFTEFNVAQEAETNFALGTSGTDVRGKCMTLRRTMAKNLQIADQATFRIGALCSDEFFDALISHANVKEAFANWQAARTLMESFAFGRFDFAGIEFHNYRGTDDGSFGVATDKAHFFPIIDNLFKTYYAPADTIEFANTIGLPRYVLPFRDPRDKFFGAEVQQNPLNICLRPKVLMQGRRA